MQQRAGTPTQVVPQVLVLTPRAEVLAELRVSSAEILIVAEPSLARGLDRLAGEPWALVVLDTAFEEQLVLDLVERLAGSGQRVALLAATPDAALVRTATARGAAGVLATPLSSETLAAVLGRASPARGSDPARPLVGTNPAFVAAFDTAARVARTSATVLIEGESGTGKELLAQFVHAHSPRAARAFVAVNCGAIPEGLLESELFGHEKGAFTGALGRHLGRFERANGGTLFLDEASEMGAAMQAKLLRVLQERTLERVGGHESIRVDVRIIAASNRDLAAEVDAGRFRQDLYYRLAVIPLRLPALRERLDDVPHLAAHFLRVFAQEHGRATIALSEAALDRLSRYTWPGNVRQLQNVVERAVLLTEHAVIAADDLDLPAWPSRTPSFGMPAIEPRVGTPPFGMPALGAAASRAATDTPLPLEQVERQEILRALATTGGHLAGAAQLLGIHRNTLRRKLQGYRWTGGDVVLADAVAPEDVGGALALPVRWHEAKRELAFDTTPGQAGPRLVAGGE